MVCMYVYIIMCVCAHILEMVTAKHVNWKNINKIKRNALPPPFSVDFG